MMNPKFNRSLLNSPKQTKPTCTLKATKGDAVEGCTPQRDKSSFGKMISAMKKRTAGEIGLGCRSSQDDSRPMKSRKRASPLSQSSSHSTALSSSESFRFITLPLRSSSRESTIPVLSPCTYMTIALKNKKLKTRIDPFSLEQALYFEPYQEAEIHLDLLKALRGGDLKKLRGLKHSEGSQYDFESRNQFGENLIHLVCRMGLSLEVLKFLVEEVKVPLNVRDRYGRTPLHNACMSSLPNFDNVHFLVMNSPKLVVFEDDKNKVPFDLIPQRCFERWTRFLSEKNVLSKLALELSKQDGLNFNE